MTPCYIISGFLQAFLRKRDDFTLHESGPISEWELTPKEESMGDILERLGKGEAVEFTAGQMEDYFKNLSNHPKYDCINLATKFLASLVRKRIVLHKEREGDKGLKSIGKRDDRPLSTLPTFQLLKQNQADKAIFQ